MINLENIFLSVLFHSCFEDVEINGFQCLLSLLEIIPNVVPEMKIFTHIKTSPISVKNYSENVYDLLGV